MIDPNVFTFMLRAQTFTNDQTSKLLRQTGSFSCRSDHYLINRSLSKQTEDKKKERIHLLYFNIQTRRQEE